MCAHPNQSLSRTTSAFVLLDQLIQIMGLMHMDDQDPYVNRFHTWLVPRVSSGSAHHSHWTRPASARQRHVQSIRGYDGQMSIAASYHRHQQPQAAGSSQPQTQGHYEHVSHTIMPSQSLVPRGMQSLGKANTSHAENFHVSSNIDILFFSSPSQRRPLIQVSN
jgi:hypothetical protein